VPSPNFSRLFPSAGIGSKVVSEGGSEGGDKTFWDFVGEDTYSLESSILIQLGTGKAVGRGQIKISLGSSVQTKVQ